MAKTNKHKEADQRNGKKTYLIGNVFPSLSYDIKLIRESLKTNLYRGANFLNLTHTQAAQFLEKIKEEIELEKQGIDSGSTVTVFEVMIADAVMSRRWPVIESLLERIMPSHIVPLGDYPTVIEEITEDQRKRAIEVAQKVMNDGNG